jgi:hypothetical protein
LKSTDADPVAGDELGGLSLDPFSDATNLSAWALVQRKSVTARAAGRANLAFDFMVCAAAEFRHGNSVQSLQIFVSSGNVV